MPHKLRQRICRLTWTDKEIADLIKYRNDGFTWDELTTIFTEYTANALRKAYYRYADEPKVPQRPAAKVLLLDIETAPLLGYVWGLFDQNIALNQLHTDWYVLSWSAKWLGSPENEVMYADQRKAKDIEDDSKILKELHKLLNEADVIITQNGKKFDVKKINARFILHGFNPPSSYRHIDTLQIAKKHFGFTSNKLAYMTSKLCTKYKKLDHAKFSGFELWKQCLAGNIKAWEEMESYNKYDVLSLEELYLKLRPWDNSINFNVYHESIEEACNSCGNLSLIKKGFRYTNTGKFQRYICKDCGAETRGRENLLSKSKRKSLKAS